MMDVGTILTIAKASLNAISFVRDTFPDAVQQQLEMAKNYFDNAKNEDELIYAVQAMEIAVNLISRSEWSGPLYILGVERESNIEKYNILCKTISDAHCKLGHDDKVSFWNKKLIEEFWNEPGYDSLNMGSNDHIISPADMANGF